MHCTGNGARGNGERSQEVTVVSWTDVSEASQGEGKVQILSWSGCSCCPPPLLLLPEAPPPISTEITSVAFLASSSGHASALILGTNHCTDLSPLMMGFRPDKPSRS